jgi:ATP-dependent exoDNAse (exonuclease V) beta subunit
VILPTDENLLLAAGAGSGKTHALCTVALGLYGGAGGRAPLDAMRVWAVTFTDRSAAELLERLSDRARRIAGGERDEALEKILDPIDPARFHAVGRALGGAPVGTFHALCGALLRRHAAEAELDPRFAILDERAAERLRARARDEALVASLEEAGGAARVAARALGGLDAVRGALEALEAKLVEEGLAPRALVEPPPFDRAAAQSALALACAALPGALAGLAASRHARLEAARATLARERVRFGAFSPSEIGRWYAALARVCEAPRGRGALPAEAKEAWAPVERAWEALSQALAACGQVEAGRALAALAEAVRARYTVEKRAVGGLDFGDLILRARDLLAADRAVRREVKSRVGALLVDEFQDVNRLQLDLVHLLGEQRGEEHALAGGQRAASLPLEPGLLCLVGDRKQSIYDFRGADVTVFGELAERAREGDGFRLEALTRSYRSRPELVAFANRLFARVLDDGEARAYGNRWREAEDALAAVRAPGELDGAAVELLEGAGERAAGERRPEESEAVARRIAELIASGRRVLPKGEPPRPLRGGDVAILLRTFRALEHYRAALAR